MKLQNLTVIFVIITIPIILLISFYISTGLKTIKLQTMYDTGLLTATHDAIYAFEINTTNDVYSDNAETKRNILKSSVKAFEKSLCNSCNIPSYNTSEIEEYIPAIVFGMYDGFYMYAPSEMILENNSYKHNLKNYVYYSELIDNSIIIQYSLDNYIVVSGYFGNGYETKSGYLIANKVNVNEEKITYITYDEYGTQIQETKENKDAINYYEEANDFTDWFNKKIGTKKTYLKISSTNDPENENSEFSKHKREIIKNKIENVLNSSITAYSKRMKGYNYKMPKLTEDDWEKIYSNISMITFFQGKNIGLTTYNGYCVLNSTNSNEYVNSNLMYFIDGDGIYHDIRCEKCKNASTLIGYKIGDFKKRKISVRRNTKNGDKVQDGEHEANDNEIAGGYIKEGDIIDRTGKITEKNIYVYNNNAYACYTCINGTINTKKTVHEYITTEATQKQKEAYYTALARERYNTTKLTNK